MDVSSSRDPLASEPRPDAYVYDPEADAAREAMTVGEDSEPPFGANGYCSHSADSSPDYAALAFYEDGARMLVAIEVEIPEGW